MVVSLIIPVGGIPSPKLIRQMIPQATPFIVPSGFNPIPFIGGMLGIDARVEIKAFLVVPSPSK